MDVGVEVIRKTLFSSFAFLTFVCNRRVVDRLSANPPRGIRINSTFCFSIQKGHMKAHRSC
jgi:hypothetical protein